MAASASSQSREPMVPALPHRRLCLAFSRSPAPHLLCLLGASPQLGRENPDVATDPVGARREVTAASEEGDRLSSKMEAVQALSPISCVTLGKSLNLSGTSAPPSVKVRGSDWMLPDPTCEEGLM